MSMRVSLLLVLALLSCSASDDAADAARCGPSEGVVATVVDGDTIDLESGERVRYLMIDTPESTTEVECWGPEAKQANTELVAGSLTYGEIELPGESTDEVLLSTHCCHPSLANDNLSGMVVAAEPVTSVDVTAADVLAELDKALHEAGIKLCFAELKDPVKDKLKRFGLLAQIGEAFFFPTVGAAVGGYLARHAVDWVDWEDRGPKTGKRTDPA